MLAVLVNPNLLANNWQTGGLYSAPYESGQFVVIKILKTDSVGVHLRLYSNLFEQRPSSINESLLLILPADNKEGLPAGTQHVAISYASFKRWGAKFIQASTVTEEEIKSFDLWFEANDGFF